MLCATPHHGGLAAGGLSPSRRRIGFVLPGQAGLVRNYPAALGPGPSSLLSAGDGVSAPTPSTSRPVELTDLLLFSPSFLLILRLFLSSRRPSCLVVKSRPAAVPVARQAGTPAACELPHDGEYTLVPLCPSRSVHLHSSPVMSAATPTGAPRATVARGVAALQAAAGRAAPSHTVAPLTCRARSPR